MIFSIGEEVAVNGEPGVILHAIDNDNYAVTMVDTGHTCTAPIATILPRGIEVYRDALGHRQYRAEGPAGVFLVTRAQHTWEVWRSDSLNTTARDRDLQHALYRAVQCANADR
jgi:hypothetical protein